MNKEKKKKPHYWAVAYGYNEWDGMPSVHLGADENLQMRIFLTKKRANEEKGKYDRVWKVKVERYS